MAPLLKQYSAIFTIERGVDSFKFLASGLVIAFEKLLSFCFLFNYFEKSMKNAQHAKRYDLVSHKIIWDAHSVTVETNAHCVLFFWGTTPE